MKRLIRWWKSSMAARRRRRSDRAMVKVRIWLEEMRELSEWAKKNPEEARKLGFK